MCSHSPSFPSCDSYSCTTTPIGSATTSRTVTTSKTKTIVEKNRYGGPIRSIHKPQNTQQQYHQRRHHHHQQHTNTNIKRRSALEVPRCVRILREPIVGRQTSFTRRPDAVGPLLLERDQVELRGRVVRLHCVVVVLRGAPVGLVVVVRNLPQEPVSTICVCVFTPALTFNAWCGLRVHLHRRVLRVLLGVLREV